MQRVSEEAQLLVGSFSRLDSLGYSNYVLEGPKNEPLEVMAVAAVYPSMNQPMWRVFGINSEITAEYGRRIQERILGYETSQEVMELQRDLIENFRSVSESGRNATISFIETEYYLRRLPVFFILFGCTKAAGEETAHIYHPSELPTVCCLMDMQRWVRERQEQHSRVN